MSTTKLMSRHQICGMVYNATRSLEAREHFNKLLNDVPNYTFENQELFDCVFRAIVTGDFVEA